MNTAQTVLSYLALSVKLDEFKYQVSFGLQRRRRVMEGGEVDPQVYHDVDHALVGLSF